MKFEKVGLFLGGVLFGTVGIAILSSQDAKKAYTHITAAALRGKDSLMATAATVKENCGDIYADAKDINDKRYEQNKENQLNQAKMIVEQYENEDKAEADSDEETANESAE